ncbi:FG-GAP-like repeat-containing protein [Microbacterium insulae]|uniref:FG-GAP-like repeat-containing protein n=1 Tax=Microbacterium insulae TaxID=483014 RepID=A0ABW3AE68_9MICO
MRARILSILVSAVLIIGGSVVAATPATAAAGDAATVFNQTNAERARAGLKPLISDLALDRAADEWARVLAKSCSFTHSSSNWRATRVAKAGWSATGENIAAGYDGYNVVSAWMASPGHRANILDSRYTGVGIGYAKGTCYSSYWVQIFGWTKTAANPGAGDVGGDVRADVVAHRSDGSVMVYRGNGSGGWSGSAAAGSGWAATDRLVTMGDFTGDSVNDIGRIRADGSLQLLRGQGNGTYGAPVTIGQGWSGYRLAFGGVDFDGDRLSDVLAVTTTGVLMLHRGNGSGGWKAAGVKVGSGWGAMTAVFYAGDFNGDTRGDVLARRGDGTLWMYPTTGSSSWGRAQQVGKGWNSLTSVFSPGDFDGTGTSDVLARRSDGVLLLYRGNGKGGWGTVSTVGRGWNAFTGIG